MCCVISSLLCGPPGPTLPCWMPEPAPCDRTGPPAGPASGRRIEPPTREAVAPAEPPEREPAAADQPVPEEREAGVLGAGRPEPASPRQERGEPPLVSGQDGEDRPRGPARVPVHPSSPGAPPPDSAVRLVLEREPH